MLGIASRLETTGITVARVFVEYLNKGVLDVYVAKKTIWERDVVS